MPSNNQDWLKACIAQGRVSGLLEAAAAPTKPSRRGGRAIRKQDGPSKTELRYARDELEPRKRSGELVNFYHQPLKFRLADLTYYTPDYMCVAADMTISFIEVKGRKGDGPWCEEDAKVKIKVAAELYPFVFRMVWPMKGGGWSRRDY